MDKFFTSKFLSFFNSNPFLIKSIEPFSELTSLSLTIDLESRLSLTLSRSLDQSSGLDASKLLVDSAVFDSSTRSLQFNLVELAAQKNRLERIQNNSKSTLSRPEYSCDFVAVLETSKSTDALKIFETLGIKAVIDDSLRPPVTESSLKNFPWFTEINLDDSASIHDLFNWIGASVKSIKYDFNSERSLIDCKLMSIEAPLLPFKLISDLLNHLTASSTHLISSSKVCQRIPPSIELNAQRLKQFNEKKFDPTACTADQRALIIYKAPSGIVSFQLNATS